MVYPVLNYKFSAPPEIDGAVMRKSLLDAVFASKLVRTVFVQAPAGHGKTTLLQQIMSHQQGLGTALGWLTLEEGDNDPARFLANFHAVIDRAFGKPLIKIDEVAVGGVSAETFSTVDEILARLSELERPLSLFIDEFQVVSNDVIIALMGRLLERLPAQATFYIGSRNLPELGLARLQLRNSALVLTAEDLRFTREETVSFFTRTGDVPLRDEVIDDLFNRTEGWPAALQLARLAIRGGEDKPIVEMLEFSSEPQFEEYLANNVLALQPPEIQDFLLRTSVLERVAPDLCRHLTGVENAEDVLRGLEISGLFIRPLGPDRTWFRFHSLFSSYLRNQLRRRQPGATRKLHELAMEWFSANDYADDAIHHAIASENYAEAAAILESWSAQLIREGRLTTIERWLDVLPVEYVRNQPLLQMKVLWALLFLRRFHKARPLLDALVQDIESGNAQYAGSLTIPLLCSVRYLMQDDIVAAGKAVIDIDLNREPRDSFEAFEFGAIANIQSLYERTRGNFEIAQNNARVGRLYSDRGEAAFSGAYAMAFSGLGYFAQADLASALTQYREGLEAASHRRGSHASAVVTACFAEALYYDDALQEAKSLLEDALPLISQACMPDALAVAHVTLAKIRNLEGDEVDADYVLREAEKIGLESALPRVVNAVMWERVRQLLQRDEIEEARQLADHIAASHAVAPHAPHIFHAEELAGDDIGLARLLIYEEDYNAALAMLDTLIGAAQHSGRTLRALKLKTLQAGALANSGNMAAAQRDVDEVIRRLAPIGLTRLLLEEPPFVRLLEQLNCGTGATLAFLPLDVANYVEKVVTSTNGYISNEADEVRAICDALTDREIEILTMLAQGMSNKIIGAHIFVSENTVKYHLRSIFSKLGVRNRTEATNVAVRYRII